MMSTPFFIGGWGVKNWKNAYEKKSGDMGVEGKEVHVWQYFD